MVKKTGIKNGTLYGILLICLYIYAYISIGLYFIWQTHFPKTWTEFGAIAGSSIIYIVFGIISFIPVILLAIYLILKDRSVRKTVKHHWPIIAAIIYMIVPNFPGPFDEIIVAGIASGLEAYFILHTRKIESKIHENQLDSHQTEYMIENE